jgi:hypothetical protein
MLTGGVNLPYILLLLLQSGRCMVCFCDKFVVEITALNKIVFYS